MGVAEKLPHDGALKPEEEEVNLHTVALMKPHPTMPSIFW